MTISTTTNWNEATAAVKGAEKIAVVSHVSPDGDAFGSALGIGNALRQMGKDVAVAVDGGILRFLKFLPGAETVQSKLDKGEFDVFISVDSSDEMRTGESGAYARAHSKTVINLDHHATNTMFGDIHLVDPQSVSATQVVYGWLATMDFDFTPEVATPLLVGLVTDTLGFRTSNVTAETLNIAQALMQAGASLTEVTERTLSNRSYLAVMLWKHVFESVKLHKGGVIVAQVTRDDLKRVGLSETTDAGLVSFLAEVDEAMISAVFKETAEGQIELGIRCKPGYDVSKVAFALGGGGHKQAAGATIDGPLVEAKKRVLPLLKAAAKEGSLVIN
jgi:bifunctional oligoribonuclease and PAP phosphatase NrnA